jgi:Uma2 family endonuclease
MSIGQERATLDDLLKVEGKAELIGGRIVQYMATGDVPSQVASNIHFSLRAHGRKTKSGTSYSDGAGFAVSELPSGRESFSPDTSFYTGPKPANRMRFLPRPPIFAVEVGCEADYGNAAEIEMAEKRADYFAGGTLVVWDVDPVKQRIYSYRADNPGKPTVFQMGQIADALPALPGWQMPVAEVFEIE